MLCTHQNEQRLGCRQFDVKMNDYPENPVATGSGMAFM